MLQVNVTRKVYEAEGICSFELCAADGSALPAFEAGTSGRSAFARERG